MASQLPLESSCLIRQLKLKSQKAKSSSLSQETGFNFENEPFQFGLCWRKWQIEQLKSHTEEKKSKHPACMSLHPQQNPCCMLGIGRRSQRVSDLLQRWLHWKGTTRTSAFWIDETFDCVEHRANFDWKGIQGLIVGKETKSQQLSMHGWVDTKNLSFPVKIEKFQRSSSAVCNSLPLNSPNNPTAETTPHQNLPLWRLVVRVAPSSITTKRDLTTPRKCFVSLAMDSSFPKLMRFVVHEGFWPVLCGSCSWQFMCVQELG